MARLLPVIAVLLGLLGGGGLALSMRGGAPAEGHEPKVEHHDAKAGKDEAAYYAFKRPFIVPVVHDGEVSALVMLSVTVEMAESAKKDAAKREAKARDRFMRVLMALSHEGYFAGDITDPERFAEVRARLTAKAGEVYGESVADVLITDYARQRA